ncbi:MAG TPA: transcription termination factor NusA [Patescibacteria group bacterium]
MDLKKLPKTEFAASIAQLAGERGIEVQDVLDVIEQGLISAYKRDQKERGIDVPETDTFEVDLSPETGSFRVFNTTDLKKRSDVTPPGFGRIAAQTAMNVLKQGLSDLQNEKIMGEYVRKIGTLINGIIIKVDPNRIVVSLDRETEAVCPKEEQVRSENLRISERSLFLIKDVIRNSMGKREILLSRRDPEFIRQLFMREVPEVGNRTVVIEKIARAAGERTKIAVFSNTPGVDPVGSCIGQKGARIQSVLNALSPDEKVDVIAYSKNTNQFIAQALSPATGVKVESAKDGYAQVTVPENQLALAIGAGGENVRLAGILTGFEIKVKAEGTSEQ